jgi:hypothetical protein
MESMVVVAEVCPEPKLLLLFPALVPFRVLVETRETLTQGAVAVALVR